jgi:hypothetical protein
MELTFYQYIGIHVGCGFGILIITGLILALLSKYSHNIFAFLTKHMLGVELEYPIEKDSSSCVTIIIDGTPVKSKNRCCQVGFLWFISTVTCTVALMVLYEGCILGSAGVYLGDGCPSDPMTCFASSDNVSSTAVGTFQCIPGNMTTFPRETNTAWCYGWIIKRQTVSSIINQIGICGGILTVSGTFFAFMFRIFGVGKRMRSALYLIFTIVFSLAFSAMALGASYFHISFSVLAYIVVFEIYLLFLSALVFRQGKQDGNATISATTPDQRIPVSN